MFLYFIYRQWQVPSRNGWKAMALAFVAVLVPLTPYTLYNYSVHGTPSPFPNARWKFWDHVWYEEMRTHAEWQGIAFPERIIVPDWQNKTEVERDTFLMNLTVQFIRDHPQIYLAQAARRFIHTYPLITQEEIREISGSTQSAPVADGFRFGATSLDDAVHYVTLAEKIRLWSFRFILVLSVVGIFLILHKRQQHAYWLMLIILWNVIHTTALVDSERLRVQIDAFLILFAAVSVDYLWRRFGSTVSARRSTRAITA